MRRRDGRTATDDDRFRIVAFNAAEERLIGISSDEASGCFVDELLPAEIARPLIDNYRRCVATCSPVSYDEEIDLPAGHRHCVTTLVPLLDAQGRVVRILGVARDVTEEKAAIVALRASEERLRQFAENIREAFWMTNVDKTEILYVSPGYETIWGRTCESLRAAPTSWLDAIHPVDRARVEAGLPLQRESTWESTYRIVCADGTERWIRDRSFPVRDESYGVTRRIVGVAEDITQLVRAEELSRQYQKLEAVGVLAGGLAHDLNNVLSVILSYADLLRLEIDRTDPKRGDLEEIWRAGERAAELTRKLLAFSRRQPLDLRAIDLRDAVNAVDRMLRRALGGRVRLLVRHADAVGAVRADVGQIEQVLMNLVLNAGDAMPNGGTIAIETAEETLDARDAARLHVPGGPYVSLVVRDDGVGMDAATRARIFEPFFTTKAVGKGTGLGLSSALGIVRQSGGAIRVESEPGRGSEFTVYLPRIDGDGVAVSAPASSAAPMTLLQGTETVLVVEDDEAVRALACLILRRAGYTTLEASSTGDAILICEQHSGPIDLLVSDRVMPYSRGDELALRLSRLRPSMRVLFMSGMGAPPSTEALGEIDRDSPTAVFVAKPITPDALCRGVHAALDTKRHDARASNNRPAQGAAGVLPR